MDPLVENRGMRRYLLTGETPTAEIRYHPIVILKPVLILIAATAIALWLDLSISQAHAGILTYIWFGWAAVGLWTAWHWLEWHYTRIIATDKRIVLFEGWINHKVSMMPLRKVTDMGYERSIVGRLLGYGTFVFESAGQDQALSSLSFVPHPDENYRAICGLVFGLEWTNPTPEAETSATEPSDDSWADTQSWESSIYRSADLVRRDQDADTDELPPYDPYAS